MSAAETVSQTAHAAHISAPTEVAPSPSPSPTPTMETEAPSTKTRRLPFESPPDDDIQDFDMLIIGAGISGLNMAYRYQEAFPKGKYVVLEQREAMGGTWDLMRYPGIRSDSDLYTFGFQWRAWPGGVPIAEGHEILKYLKESASESGIDKHIRYQQKVVEGKWESRDQRWTLRVMVKDKLGEEVEMFYRAPFMVWGSGYYDYTKGYEAVIPGIQQFGGKVVHPQFWPQDLDYANKKVAIIGSGATTITLVPAMAKLAKKVTMVQRSPSYIISMPNRNRKKAWWQYITPEILQRRIFRWTSLLMLFFLRRLIKNPNIMKRFLENNTKAALPPNVDFDPHFKPTYAPGTQRICLCPDADFFESLRDGKAEIATGVIRTVTPDGILLESGQKIDADIIVTATGLHLAYGGGANYFIDGDELTFGNKFFWRGVMIQDVPNAALVQGYTTASWTLGADATAHLVMRMLRHMQAHKISSAVPRIPLGQMVEVASTRGIMGLTSGYVVRAKERLPKHSDKGPWKQRLDYLVDLWFARWGDFRPGLQFTMQAR